MRSARKFDGGYGSSPTVLGVMGRMAVKMKKLMSDRCLIWVGITSGKPSAGTPDARKVVLHQPISL